MMDVFTIILLFLLKSYSAEGDILAADPRLKLPVSTSTESPQMRLLIQVTKDGIVVEGASIKGALADNKKDELLIEPLLEVLKKQRVKSELIAKSNEALEFRGEALIQGDRRIPFITLEKVMYTCGMAGYHGLSLAVISRE